jgi:UDPglucose 6-dehydrogenase
MCGDTSEERGSSAGLSHINSAVGRLLPHLKPDDIVVGKSTVPVGTAERLATEIQRVQPEAILAWNPELLREGHPWTTRSSQIDSSTECPRIRMDSEQLGFLTKYAKIRASGTPLIMTDYTTAELVKGLFGSKHG